LYIFYILLSHYFQELSSLFVLIQIISVFTAGILKYIHKELIKDREAEFSL
jgi:hypothetical protein